jgi:hypothetical protein
LDTSKGRADGKGLVVIMTVATRMRNHPMIVRVVLQVMILVAAAAAAAIMTENDKHDSCKVKNTKVFFGP